LRGSAFDQRTGKQLSLGGVGGGFINPLAQ
jgi:hypothetical protein